MFEVKLGSDEPISETDLYSPATPEMRMANSMALSLKPADDDFAFRPDNMSDV